jgi:hypothetical protein
MFGDELARWYAGPGAHSPSRSRSGPRGTENNAARLGLGKLGEVAVALFFDLPPDEAVKWTCGGADKGADLELPVLQLRADVKTSEAWKRYLLWSNTVNDLYTGKQFDVLIGVSAESNWQRCFIDGYIYKPEFLERKLVACDAVAPELEPGTWHIAKVALTDIRLFGEACW